MLAAERVHRRDDEERLRQHVPAPGERDELLLHRLEEGGLEARRGAVDLVEHDGVREDRAGLEAVGLADPLAPHHLAEDVVRADVRRALDARVVAADRAGDDPRERRLAGAGHVLDEQVAAREQRDEREPGRTMVSIIAAVAVFRSARASSRARISARSFSSSST